MSDHQLEVSQKKSSTRGHSFAFQNILLLFLCDEKELDNWINFTHLSCKNSTSEKRMWQNSQEKNPGKLRKWKRSEPYKNYASEPTINSLVLLKQMVKTSSLFLYTVKT
jgi:hypothetical protein